MTRRALPTGVLAALVLSLFAATTPSGALAATADETARINVVITTPQGVPAAVGLNAKSTYVAVKPVGGTTSTTTLDVVPGSYKVAVEPLTYDGRLYLPSASRPEVPVIAGRTGEVRVGYTLDESVRDFRIAKIERTALDLTWTAGSQYEVIVRRTSGSTPAKAPDQGVGVPVKAGVASDAGLSAGTTYTYALFTHYRSKWVGPMVVRAGTRSDDPGVAAYVAKPQTLMPTVEDLVSAVPTGAGVRVVLAKAPASAPVPGSAVVLPITPALAGGFLGVITSVGPDGRTLELTAGGISDGFDYYKLSVPEFTGGDPIPEEAPDGETGFAAKSAGPAATSLSKAGVKDLLYECLGGNVATEVEFNPSLALAGHFDAEISTYSVLGMDIPKGASLDMSMMATVAGAADLKVSSSVTCSTGFGPFVIQIAAAPVPMIVLLEPEVELALSGGLEISNVGLAVTSGMQFSGHIGLSDASFSGGPVFHATPLKPKVVSSGSIDLKLGGQVIVGPGVGTSAAGVIAGVSGDFYPIDASFGAVFPQGDSRYNKCLRASAGLTLGLGVTAKAWMGNFDVSKTFQIPGLHGTVPYFGSPWYLPTDCQDATADAETPSDDVLGSGVTKEEEHLVGEQSQWDHVSGFVPSKSTWVLSTGRVADSVGSPGQSASSTLGRPGDAELSAMAGRPTYDAVAYTVRLVPLGSKLHVRYVFASEEYPEFVGSQFNDVMAVFVNGVNCATVPGTSSPVSINTVNAGQNSQYYVDNLHGASGYGTTMDGLTKPLECVVPVTPNVPVTVKIAVADASDSIYDSAVALLDDGIWSD